MVTNKGAPQNVEAYISRFPEDVRAKLNQMRAIIKAIAPDAEEKIAYQMPAYHWNGPLVYFSGFKNHIGFFPTGEALDGLEADLAGYKRSKGTIQFPLADPIPVGLVEKIVQYRLAANQKKIDGKKKSLSAKS